MIGGVLAAAVAVFAVNAGTKMVKSIQSAMKSMQKLGSAAVDMVGKLFGVSAAEDAVGASGEAAGGGFDTAAAGAAALDAVPIVALIVGIVAAIALLVVGVIELIKHWSAVTAFFKKVWGAA